MHLKGEDLMLFFIKHKNKQNSLFLPFEDVTFAVFLSFIGQRIDRLNKKIVYHVNINMRNKTTWTEKLLPQLEQKILRNLSDGRRDEREDLSLTLLSVLSSKTPCGCYDPNYVPLMIKTPLHGSFSLNLISTV